MSNDLRANEFFNDLAKRGIQISEEQKRRIQEKINSVLTYEPRIAILGKSGNGKSSLCNALFGQNICPISDIAACTRNVKEVLLHMGGNGLKLIDVPGVGENKEKDEEYAKLYSTLLPEIDLVLWILKADDRAYTSDEFFYTNIVKPHIDKGKPIFFVLNQSDKIEPCHEWDKTANRPGITQFNNIHQKIDVVSKYFNIASSKVIPVSAKYGYNLFTLVDEIVFTLPREKKFTFFKGVSEKHRSNNSTSEVKKVWYEILLDFFSSVIQNGKEIVVKILEKSGTAIERFLEKILR